MLLNVDEIMHPSTRSKSYAIPRFLDLRWSKLWPSKYPHDLSLLKLYQPIWNLWVTNALSSFDLVPVTMASVNSSVLLVLLIATQHGARIRKWPVLLWCQGCSIWMGLICGDWSENDSNSTNTQAGKSVRIFGTLPKSPKKESSPINLKKWNWICDHQQAF